MNIQAGEVKHRFHFMVPGPPRQQPCDSCVSRGDTKPATMRCLNCQECLCADCHRAHQRLNLTKNHLTIAIEVCEQDSVFVFKRF